jgi:RNA polymerase sigma factor (sigma-70 family)
MMATTYLTWWRRRWRGEVPTSALPETPGDDPYAGSELRQALARLLAELPRRQRAVLMLRYHADLTEAATAQALGISVGTVKSHTARALASLRANPAVRAILTEEVPR